MKLLFQSIGQRRGLLLLGLSMTFIMLLGLFWDDDSDDYAELSRLMLQLKTLDARFDRDMLRIASFLMVQYDPLVKTSNELNQIRTRFNATADRDHEQLSEQNRLFWQTMKTKLDLLEKIKFQAALVRNGIHYLPTLAQTFNQQEPAHYNQIVEFINQLYSYQLSSADSHFNDILGSLEQIKQWSLSSTQSRDLVEQLLFHIDSNLHGLAKLDSLKKSYLEVPSQTYFSALHEQLEKQRVTETAIKRQLIVLLSLSVCALIIGLWLLIRSLHNAHLESKRAWNRLHDAVDNLSEAFALFDADHRPVLYNRRFEAFYPWLKEYPIDSLTLDELQAAVAERTEYYSLEGSLFTDPRPQGQYVEQIDNNTWYLASNKPTSEGGMVCVRSDISASKRAEADSRKLSRVLKQSPASVVITDTQGVIEYVNPWFERVSGYSAAEAIGQNSSFLKSGNLSRQDYETMWTRLKAGREWRGMFHNRHKDGSTYWESASISPLRDEHGKITSFIAVKEDITAQKLAEDQLRMNAAVFDTTAEGIMVTDAENRIKTVNPAFTRITGYGLDDVLGKSPQLLKSGRHEPAFYEQLWNSVRQQGHWSGEIWNKRKDGTLFPEWLSISAIKGANGDIEEYVAVFTDITQHKENEEQIRYQANYDALTGLPNRTLLSDRLKQAIASAKREQWMLGILFLDLDHFKVVNDTFGHAVGDELLQLVAARIKACLRESDTIARFGGDEFVILLQDIAETDSVAQVATYIIDQITRGFSLNGREISIGASIGITIYPDDAANADTLLQNADMAMYQAKERGRSTYQFFTLSMQQKTLDRRQLELELRHAIKNGELEIYYQPVVNPSLNQTISVEALLRWNHPKRGQVSPATFIPIAEDSGQIGEIGRWVLSNACRQLKVWQDAGFSNLKLAVNLSSRQRELGLEAADLQQVIDQAGIKPESLTLEITESLLIRDTEEALVWLSSLKALGVKLSVDDFGTGYSSLSYLKRFPVDALKIDRSFVSDLPEDLEDATLVKTIVAMAQNLNLSLVAEGVETQQQAEFLVNNSCRNLQGFYYARPMPAAEVGTWLSKPPSNVTSGPTKSLFTDSE
ncbi:EAL domain-containing protein [Motiliproteus coralliicola]|uniref:cyclic-guanylate-specific phosphodiesterase n=1 Tax=Motiliproteus coralliicola TaxID=2283196 RepID=A0A369WTG5_9GAMM|nr:EAL domain-containing protein [Motiliproteus coralliicola]RDE24433.1 EAL domain-containing protein [Motiliproteus coralliicola]